MRDAMRLLLLLLLSGCGGVVPRYGTPPAPAQPVLDQAAWEDLEQRAASLLADLVQIDTTHPRGGEQPAAELLRRALEGTRVQAEVVPAGPIGRASLFARLPAKTAGAKAPILLVSNLDTHPAVSAAWPREAGPWSGRVIGGALHGRGVLNGKGLAVLHLFTLLALEQVALDRDVILVAAADGARGEGLGMTSVLQAHPEIGTASVALAGGGYVRRDMFDEGLVLHTVATAEKGYAVLKVTAVGSDGGRPASVKLAEGLGALFHHPDAPRLTPPAAVMLDHLADAVSFPKSTVLRSRLLTRLLLLSDLASAPATRPLFTDTLEITNLSGGGTGRRSRPDRAHATITAYLLPGHTPAGLRNEIRAWIGDPDVHVTILSGGEANETTPAPAVLSTIAENAARPGEVVMPSLGVEATDARVLRRTSVPVYGYYPIPLDLSDLESIHGPREKVKLADYGRALRIIAGIVRDLGASTR